MIKGAFFLERITENIVDKIVKSGVNEVSIKWEHWDQALIDLLRSNKIKIYAEVSLFVHEEMWQKYPDSRPIDRDGTPMEPINWYYGVCPNHSKVQEEKLSIIDQVIDSIGIDGIWLDFIRYPCHWEEVRNSNITEYCFCARCLEKFDKDVGGTPEGEDWIRWKCHQITDFVQEVRNRIKVSNKNIQLGIFAVPWAEYSYGNAIHKIVCQDFRELAKYIDLFGVMTYHRLTEQSISWIGEVVEHVAQVTQKSVIPLIQSMDIPVTISGDEFRRTIQNAIGNHSEGVIVFHFHDLLEHGAKYEIMKNEFVVL